MTDFNFRDVFEMKRNMMPRKKHHAERSRQAGMDQADDILNSTDTMTEISDPETFEIVDGKSPKDMTEAQKELYDCACSALDNSEHGMAFAIDQLGNMLQVSKEETDIGDWFTQANQEFLTRVENGERWIEVANDLSRQFAKFFGGSYEALDFANDAFGRRAWEWGLTEAQAMVDNFTENGTFDLPEAKYQDKDVDLNKPSPNSDGGSKFKVYVNSGKKNADGTVKVKKVTFGDPNMKIKKSDPKRKKSFRARHNCDNPGPKTSARYWSCRKW